jgi:hypothetical protein
MISAVQNKADVNKVKKELSGRIGDELTSITDQLAFEGEHLVKTVVKA